MITLNPVENIHHYDQHLILINIEDKPELSRYLNNPFALSENPYTMEFRQVDPQQAAEKDRAHLWTLIQRKGAPYKEMVKLAKASKAGKWIELSYAVEQKHAEILAKCIAWLETQVTPEEPVKLAPTYTPVPALESMIGFIDYEEQRDEEIEEMYSPVTAPRLKAEDHDVPLNMIAWITGKRASVLAYMQDDFTAIAPSGELINLKGCKIRFAKHWIGRLPHVQRTLIKAYSEHFYTDEQYMAEGDADWSYDPEQMPSNYDAEVSSRYETDTDPTDEENHNHDDQIDYIALAAYDSYTGGIVGAHKFNYISVDELDHVNEVYTRTADHKPLKIRKITDQAKGSPRRHYATRNQAQEYRRKFA